MHRERLEYILNQPTNVTDLVNLQASAGDGFSHSLGMNLRFWKVVKRRCRFLAKERSRVNELFHQAPGFICILQGPQHTFLS